MPTDVTAATFDAATAEGRVLVDFHADWCGPCRAVAPVLEQLDGDRDDLTVVKVDVDAEPELAGRFQVRSVPTLLLLDDGRPVARKVGAASRRDLDTWIDTA